MKKKISNNKRNIELTLLCLPTIIWYCTCVQEISACSGEKLFLQPVLWKQMGGAVQFPLSDAESTDDEGGAKYISLQPGISDFGDCRSCYHSSDPILSSFGYGEIHCPDMHASSAFYVLGHSQLFCLCFSLGRQRDVKCGI